MSGCDLLAIDWCHHPGWQGLLQTLLQPLRLCVTRTGATLSLMLGLCFRDSFGGSILVAVATQVL